MSKPDRRRKTRGPSRLKFRVKARRIDRDGSAVGVVSGIDEILIIEREGRPLVDAVRVVGSQHLFRAVLEGAVADEDSDCLLYTSDAADE